MKRNLHLILGLLYNLSVTNLALAYDSPTRWGGMVKRSPRNDRARIVVLDCSDCYGPVDIEFSYGRIPFFGPEESMNVKRANLFLKAMTTPRGHDLWLEFDDTLAWTWSTNFWRFADQVRVIDKTTNKSYKLDHPEVLLKELNIDPKF